MKIKLWTSLLIELMFNFRWSFDFQKIQIQQCLYGWTTKYNGKYDKLGNSQRRYYYSYF